MAFEITPAAQKFIRMMVLTDGGPSSGFRLAVSPGGCTGLAADISIKSEPEPGDAVVDEDLDSAYVEHDQLDLALWARDAIAEVVPVSILCREDCAGLCPTCGANRNLAPCDCVVEVVDSRWEALRELAERMSKEPGAG